MQRRRRLTPPVAQQRRKCSCSLKWTVSVPPMLLLQNDTMKTGFPVTRGYRLLAGSASTALRTVAVDAFAPSTASVRVIVDLQTSGIYQDIQLFERVTLAQLLSSLLGTLGLLGVFGIVAKHIERPLLTLLPFSGYDPHAAAAGAASDFVSSNGFLGQTGGQIRPVGAAAANAEAGGRDSLWSVQSPLSRTPAVATRAALLPHAAAGAAQLAVFDAHSGLSYAFDGKEQDFSCTAASAAPTSMEMSRGERVARGSYAPSLAQLDPRSAGSSTATS